VIALDGLAPTLSGKPNIIFISLGADQHSAAARIYMALRQAEQFGRTTYVQLMDEEGIGIAYKKPLVRQESWLIKVARTGLVAALYVVLTYLSSVFNLAFGPLQFRVSESLTLLPLIWGETVFGLTVGTLLSNLGSPYGIIDWVFWARWPALLP